MKMKRRECERRLVEECVKAGPLGPILKRGRALHAGLAGLAIASLTLAALAEEPANNPAPPLEPAEAFKRFIASPPPIESLIYRVKLADPAHSAAGVEGSTNYQLYLARWQPNGWLVRPIASADDPDSREVRAGAAFVFDDECWHLHPSGVADLWIEDNPVIDGFMLDPSTAAFNPVKMEVTFLRRNLSEVLNMGLFNVEPGTVRWEGSQFQAYYAERQQTIVGWLALSETGLPLYLSAAYQAGTNMSRYVLRYAYERDVGLPFLPSQIRVFQLVDSREVERAQTTILLVRPGAAIQRKPAFDPKPFIAYNHFALRRFTNGALFALNKKGRWVRVGDESFWAGFRRPSPQFFYATVTLVTLSFLVLMVRARKEAANQT